MKIQRAWIPATLAAALAALGIDVSSAVAQYPQYGAAPQYSAATPYGVAPRATQPPVYSQTQTPAYGTQPYGTPATAQAPQAAYQQQAPYQQNAAPYGVSPQQAPQYQQPQATNPYLARRMDNSAASNGQMQGGQMQGGENLPAPADQSMMNGNTMNGTMMQSSPDAATQAGYGSPAGCGCGNQYPSTGMGGECCNTGCEEGYGVSNYFGGCNDTQWFGGVYWLFMDRDNPSFHRLTVQINDNNVGAYPYYPPSSTTVLSTIDADSDFRSGAEIRFGSTFGIGGGCDSGYGGGCGGCGGCGQSCATTNFAWETAYWAIDDNENVATITTDLGPVDNYRYYGMKNFAGITYDYDGAGVAYQAMPVNSYYDYQVPVQMPTAPAANDVRVRYQTIRSNFQAQNLELNFLKLPLICTSSCAPACGGCGGCDSGCGGYGACGGCGGCDSCGPAFSLTGLCGARYFKIDDDFFYVDGFQIYDGANWNDGTLTYQANVDNQLIGFQLGCNMNYCVACKWNFFCDSNFGLYNNNMSSYQRVYGANGDAVDANGNPVVSSTSKDDIAFLGELRFGGAYDVTCHWRAVAAYRAVAVSGVALSTEQMPENFANINDIGRINNDGSIIIHGLQIGAECRY